MKIAIVGVTGYSGTVLFSLLKQHPAVTEIHLYGHQSEENTTVRYLDWEVPSLIGEHLPIEPFQAEQVMAANDVIFFATPAGVTSRLAAPFIVAHFPVIDLSGDFRLKQAASYEQWYHRPAAKQQNLAVATYGLADLPTPQSQYIANPGCYATATLLGLAPLVQQKLIQLDSVIVDAKSGTSGAGKGFSTTTQFTTASDNLQLYKVNKHQHLPEIMQQLKVWEPKMAPIQFSTTLIPVTRGIMATIYTKLASQVNPAELQTAFASTYANQPFVKVLPTGLPTLKMVVGSNNCLLGLAYNPVTRIVMVVSVIDNLLKGAAGQAVQNFNQLFHYPVAQGLPTAPMPIY